MIPVSEMWTSSSMLNACNSLGENIRGSTYNLTGIKQAMMNGKSNPVLKTVFPM